MMTAPKLAHIERVRALLAANENRPRHRGKGCRRFLDASGSCSHCRANGKTRVHGATARQLATRRKEHRLDLRHASTVMVPAAKAIARPAPPRFSPSTLPRRSFFRRLGGSILIFGGDR